MQSISTKTGDRGESSLADGSRLPKSNQVFSVLGSVDELNAQLGMCASLLTDHASAKKMILKIQDALFYFGAEIARSPKVQFHQKALDSVEEASEKLQNSMKEGWTTQFLLPGGNQISAQLDVTRAVCRRAERELSQYADVEEVREILFQYLNRLSDYLFVLRCYINRESGVTEKAFESSFQKEFLR